MRIGNIAISDIVEFGGYDWRVLDMQDDKALLLSEFILEHRRFHNNEGNITWEHSDLRRYLNNEFYNRWFTNEERASIAETQVRNSSNPWFGTDGGNDTYDYIFLLNIEEVVRYFGDSRQLQNRPQNAWYITDRYNGSRLAFDVDTPNKRQDIWWLRSVGEYARHAAFVWNVQSGIDPNTNRGYINVSGRVNINSQTQNSNVAALLGGVRPAMWVYISDFETISR